MSEEARRPTVAHRPIGYWLKLVDRLIDENFADVFLHTGLTRRHWQVFTMVRDGVADEVTIGGVFAPVAGPSGGGAGVAAEIEDLVRRGWVSRSGGGLSVTVTGRQAYDELLDDVTSSRDRLTAGITPEQYDQTIETLRTMARNLGWSG